MKPPGNFVQGAQLLAHGIGAAATREHVPICQAASAPARPNDAPEEALVVFLRHVFEDVAKVEGVNARSAFSAEKVLDRRAMPLDTVEIGADAFEILRAQSIRKRRNVTPGENPLRVGIPRRIQFRQGIARALEDAIGNTAFDVLKETRIPAQTPHDKSREENLEQQSPPSRIPFLLVEIDALIARAAGEQPLDLCLRMDQRQNARPKRGEV